MKLIVPSSTPLTISQIEVDFGTTGVSESSFIINDDIVTASSKIVASVAYIAPTGKDLDEIEMDDLEIRCNPGSGQFTILIRAIDGSFLADKFKIDYIIG